MKKQFKYDAFISYRHTDLDRYVAENLHKHLETFRLPGNVAKKRKGMKNKIERVFRDKEELPLTSNLEDPIIQALQSSEWLIVICTPRLPESLWCKKEIETFIKLRGRAHILAVLAEGEPAESFPEELLYRIEERTLADGTVEEVKIPVEPLAADMRGKNKKAVLKAMKLEMLRLLAAMFEIPYDDLRQRHRERKMRRILTATALGGAACLLFGIYSTATAIRIQRQNEQIEAQSAEIQAQSTAIKQQAYEIQEQANAIRLQSEEIAKQNAELAYRQACSLAALAESYLEAGNRAAAINTAVEALTISDGIELPYTPQAQMVLAESVRAYDTGNSYKAEYQFETTGRIQKIEMSADADTLLIADDTGAITLFDLKQREVVQVFTGEEMTNAYTFLGQNYFVYEEGVASDGEKQKLKVYDLTEKAVVKEIEPSEQLSRLYADANGTYLVGKPWGNQFAVFDGASLEYVGDIVGEKEGYVDTPYLFNEGIMAYVLKTAKQEEYLLYFVDLNTQKMISSFSLGDKQLKDLTVQDGIAYLAAYSYEDYFGGSDSYVQAVDVERGVLLWEQVFADQWADSITLPVKEGAESLLFVAGSNIAFVNKKTGEAGQLFTLTSDVVMVKPQINANDYILICEDGQMCATMKEYGGTFDMERYFECATIANEEILTTKHGIVVLEKNDCKITIYTIKAGPDVTAVDRELALPQNKEVISSEAAVEIAASYQVDRPEYVRELYYSEDKKYCFINYWDNMLLIYDVEKAEVCNTIEDCFPTRYHMGEDAQGQIYLLGYYGCYVLNKDMEAVMWIPNAKEIDMEKQKVYIEWSSNYCFEAPIYTLEQLIEMGQRY